MRFAFVAFDHLPSVVRSLFAGAAFLALGATVASAQGTAPSPGVRLADLTWIGAEKLLDSSTVVVIALGAESKEHGPQLRLKNDFLLANYYAERVLRASRIVLAPTINYSFYPSFVEYPGSTTLRFETARDMVVDICRSLARYGPKRCYILNTGISTVRVLEPARDSLVAVREGKTFSRTGIYGDATLATREKGRRVVEAQVLDLLEEIEALRRTPIP